MGEKRVVDLSSFLLFEESGDSSDANFNTKIEHYYHANRNGGRGNDDDDAESSCSYGEHDTQTKDAKAHDLSKASNDNAGGGGNVGGTDDAVTDWREANDDHQHHNGYVEGNDDNNRGDQFRCKSWVSTSRRTGEEGEGDEWEGLLSEVTSTANSHSSRSRRKCRIVGKRKKKLNEKEKSRLFWEGCLASNSFSKLCSRLLFS